MGSGTLIKYDVSVKHNSSQSSVTQSQTTVIADAYKNKRERFVTSRSIIIIVVVAVVTSAMTSQYYVT